MEGLSDGGTMTMAIYLNLNNSIFYIGTFNFKYMVKDRPDTFLARLKFYGEYLQQISQPQ